MSLLPFKTIILELEHIPSEYTRGSYAVSAHRVTMGRQFSLSFLQGTEIIPKDVELVL